MSIQSIAAEMKKDAPNSSDLREHAADYCEMALGYLRSADDLLVSATRQIAGRLYPADLVVAVEQMELAVKFVDFSLSASNRMVRR